MTITAAPQVRLMDKFLHDGSAARDLEEGFAAISDPCNLSTLKIVEAHTGKATAEFYSSIHSLVRDSHKWAAIPKAMHTAECKSFALARLAKAAGPSSQRS
jgi:hypothetical protein